MTITIVTPNKISQLYKEIIRHFHKMLRQDLIIKSVEAKKKLPPIQQMAYEAELMLKEIKRPSAIIALDANGLMMSSEKFASNHDKLQQEYKNIYYIIGGPYGIDKNLLNQATQKISLSAMTLPNQLAITVLIEQLYRAETILNNHPYHK